MAKSYSCRAIYGNIRQSISGYYNTCDVGFVYLNILLANILSSQYLLIQYPANKYALYNARMYTRIGVHVYVLAYAYVRP